MKKIDPDPDSDQSKKLNDWSLAEIRSFHKIWFKPVNNFLRYPADRQTHIQGMSHSHYFRYFVGGGNNTNVPKYSTETTYVAQYI